MSAYTYTSQVDIRRAFWEQTTAPGLYRATKRQNDYGVAIRMEWCDFVEYLCRDGQISEALANRVTL